MNKFVLFFIFIAVALSGCRTYIGSSDVYNETNYELVSETTNQDNTQKGVIVKNYENGFELSFIEKYQIAKRYESNRYYRGREYYYFKAKRAHISNEMLYFPGLGYAIILIGDAYCAFTKGLYDWQLEGDYLPGLGYLIAYIPGINLLFTPVLRAPYVYKGISSTDRSELKDEGDLVGKNVYYEYMDDYDNDYSGSEITVTCNKISKTYTPDSFGKFTFSINDFIKYLPPVNKKISFIIHHHKWNKKWELTSSVLVDPEALRDWNIMADNNYDYLSRAAATARLSKYYGEKRCREYLQKLLNNKLNVETIRKGSFIIKEHTEKEKR